MRDVNESWQRQDGEEEEEEREREEEEEEGSPMRSAARTDGEKAASTLPERSCAFTSTDFQLSLISSQTGFLPNHRQTTNSQSPENHGEPSNSRQD